ncbi:MAG: translation elongation factor Ts, partial [Parachlamydiaceae bacterium]
IAFAEGPEAIAVVEVNAETDFVVRNDRFQDFVTHLSKEIVKVLPESLENFLKHSYVYNGHEMTVDEHRSSLIQAIGENIQIKRLQIFPKQSDKSIGVYSHLGGKIVTIVEISGSDQEEAFAKDIAMHVAAASPDFLSPESVPANILAQEREIAESQIQGKPANMVEKIVDGKLEAYYGTVCLTRQKYIKNDQQTIEQLVNQRAKEVGKSLKITGFVRWGLNQS